MPIQDVTVEISIAYPAPKIGLGRPVIFAQKTGTSSYKEYTSIDGVAADFVSGTAAHAKAKAIFEQKNRPDSVAIATYDTDVAAALAQYYNRPWHFALIAGDVAAAQVAAAGYINTKDFKFVAVQVKDDAGREAVKGKKRTIIFDHNVTGEHLDAAVIGNLASLDVGSITWKFKQVTGVTARYLTSDELTAIDADNTNTYVVKAGRAQLSEGKLANGEYIDVLHGQDWIKADMENEIQVTMQESEKLPYDSRGIGAIEAAATTTLRRAFQRNIIGLDSEGLPDFSVTALTREQADASDRASRIYRGLSFEFSLAGAIHETRVKGTITT